VLEAELEELSMNLKKMEIDYMKATKDLGKLEEDQQKV
jgi:hypothetical protein